MGMAEGGDEDLYLLSAIHRAASAEAVARRLETSYVVPIDERLLSEDRTLQHSSLPPLLSVRRFREASSPFADRMASEAEAAEDVDTKELDDELG